MEVVLFILALVFIALLSIFLFVFMSIRKNIHWYSNAPTEGKFVDAHGNKTFYRVKGKGEPAIVVIHSMGSSQAEWWPIQNEIGLKYRMITWDRAGYGWNSPKENPPTAASVAEELDNLLKFERIKKPVYIVSNGTGTLYARYYAATHPKNVAAMLFIDPIPLDYAYWTSSLNEIEDCPKPLEKAAKNKIKASRGYYRLLSPFKGYKLDSRYRRHIVEHYTRTESYDIYQKELSQIDHILTEIEKAGDFPAIPLRILYPANESLIRDWVRNGMPEYSARQKGRLHQDCSRTIVSLSPKATCREIEGSGEFIHLSKPDIVAREILDLVKG